MLRVRRRRQSATAVVRPFAALAATAATTAFAVACVARRPAAPSPAREPRDVAAAVAPAAAATVQRDEIAFTVPARVERVTPRVVSLFLESGIAVTSAMGNVVEAKLPREYQWVGRYQITARAYVTPLSGGATSVRLVAEETRDASALGGETRRVGDRSRGRALRVWRGLEQVARRLAADTALAPPRALAGHDSTTAGPAVSGAP